MPLKNTDGPFSLNLKLKNPLAQKFFNILRPSLETILSLKKAARVHAAAQDTGEEGEFARNVLDIIGVDYEIDKNDFNKIPREGKALIISNHPFGGLEGLMLGAILRSVRKDSKIMANFLLGRIPELKNLFVLVDPYGSKASTIKNIGAMKEAFSILKKESLLALFPSGDVSCFNMQEGKISDPPWSKQIAKMVRSTKAPVVPIYFNGGNSFLFNLFSMIHPRLKTALLPRELLKKRKNKIKVKISAPIPAKDLMRFESDEDMIKYLRSRVYLQEGRNSKNNTKKTVNKIEKIDVIKEGSRAEIKKEVEKISKTNTVFSQGEYSVLVARAYKIPCLMQEIGRLREVTFREVGEGTGKDIDLDLYDNCYLHLFIWDKDREMVVGSYRLGLTDEIIDKFGKNGLYSNTLFKYKREIFNYINPGVEMGRSFIRAEYQKSYAPLMLLWKGIGHFVCANPKYKILFGPVSINDEYTNFSQDLITRFLCEKHYDTDLAKYVKPRSPFKKPFLKRGFDTKNLGSLINDIDEVSSIISEFEHDSKGVPILLKQYLKLNGKLLGFNVDPDFSRVLDGLILVDLTTTDERILARYMGKEGARGFLDFHNKKESPVEDKMLA